MAGENWMDETWQALRHKCGQDKLTAEWVIWTGRIWSGAVVISAVDGSREWTGKRRKVVRAVLEDGVRGVDVLLIAAQ